MVRLITHGGCTDGFFSAYVFKRYFTKLLNIEITEVIGSGPKDVQSGNFEFQETDVVLDLPLPKTKVLFWCDHHETSRPNEEMPENYYWAEKPSCTGYLIDILEEKGINVEKLRETKIALDKIDNAEYTLEEVKQCYYLQKNFESLTSLQKAHAITSIIKSKDFNINKIFSEKILSGELSDNPLEDESIWKMNPVLFFKARLQNLQDWRDWADEIIEVKNSTYYLDERKSKTFPRGVFDRFYGYVKFPEALFGILISGFGKDKTRISISSNIFRKEEVNVDIGQICFSTGKVYGIAGGGHKMVGSCIVEKEKLNEALNFVEGELSKNQ